MNEHQTTHPCPIAGCTVGDVPYHHLMCGAHWGRVPKGMQNAVYRSWNRGRPTSAYLGIRQVTIAFVEAKGAL